MEQFASLFSQPAVGGPANLTPASAITMLLTTFIIGLMISITYILTYAKTKKAHSQSFVITVVMLPAIIATVVMFVGSNLASAFSLSGAFALIRFRNTLGDIKDITYIFFAVATGLAVGVGLPGYALLFALVLCLMMILLKVTNYGKTKIVSRTLKITIPESMHFKGAFDDVFEKYGVSAKLRRVRTVDLGSLYELVYEAEINDDVNEKEFIDDLRCRNGNLNIVLMMRPEGDLRQ